MVMPGSPLTALPKRGRVDLMDLAGEGVLDELTELAELARAGLLPRMHALAEIRPTSGALVTLNVVSSSTSASDYTSGTTTVQNRRPDLG